jgi:hypothetical protein
VRSTEESFSAFLRWHLAPFHRPREDPGAVLVEMYVREEDEPPAPYSYHRWSEVRYSNRSLVDVSRYALWDIPYQASQNVRAYVALHAGAVVRNGGALLLPGPMESGKSTLVAALLSRGFGYLSDEVGALDPITSRVYPFPKYLYLDQSSVDLFPGLDDRLEDGGERSRGRLDRTVRPEDLDAQLAGPSQPQQIVFLGTDRAGRPRLEPIPGAEAVERLAENCFNLHRYGDRGVVFLSRIASRVRAFRLEGGTTLERAELLTERFASG